MAVCLLHRSGTTSGSFLCYCVTVCSSAVTNNRMLPSTPTCRLPPTVACDCLITTHVSTNLSSHYDYIENCTHGTHFHCILDHIYISYVTELDATCPLCDLYSIKKPLRSVVYHWFNNCFLYSFIACRWIRHLILWFISFLLEEEWQLLENFPSSSPQSRQEQ